MTDDQAISIGWVMAESHRVAESLGWHEPREIDGVVRDSSLGERIALMHEELTEALQAYRRGQGGFYFEVDGKPEGVVVELADAVIRICETAEREGWPLGEAIVAKMEWNKRRPQRHGGMPI